VFDIVTIAETPRFLHDREGRAHFIVRASRAIDVEGRGVVTNDYREAQRF
jgi:hypothetical protein